jgi:hypothetical protein
MENNTRRKRQYPFALNMELIDMEFLIDSILDQVWHRRVEIVPDYMPPFPSDDTKPKCIVRYKTESGNYTYLRYGRGPLPDYFWDLYGDDFHQPECALLCIAKAPAPRGVDTYPAMDNGVYYDMQDRNEARREKHGIQQEAKPN